MHIDEQIDNTEATHLYVQTMSIVANHHTFPFL